MSADVLEAPSGVRCVSVVGFKRRLDQRVSPADPSIEKSHIAGVGGEVVGAALQQILRPARLFDDVERVEEVGGNCWRGQGPDGAKAPHREGKRVARRLGDDDDIFRKVEPVRCDRDAECRGRRKEGIGICRIEPNLPVNWAVCCRKFVRRAAPKCAKPYLGDGAETLNQRRMFGPARDHLAVLLPRLVIFVLELGNLCLELVDAFRRREYGRLLGRSRRGLTA